MKAFYLFISMLAALYIGHETTDDQAIFFFTVMFVWGGFALLIIEMFKTDVSDDDST